MRITVISDTHGKHDRITKDLPGGDVLIHAGDISSMGTAKEIISFCKWYDRIDNYDTKIFIAGNHDWGFQTDSENSMQTVNSYKSIDYIQDDSLTLYFDGPNGDHPEDNIRIYGSPWQPFFHNWAFNLLRGSQEMIDRWNKIPDEIDIVVTHTPIFGKLDDVQGRRGVHLGCEDLQKRLICVKPKIHICGHIHSGYGYAFDGDTHYFNAAVLDEEYQYSQLPITFDWKKETNEINFVSSPLIF